MTPAPGTPEALADSITNSLANNPALALGVAIIIAALFATEMTRKDR